LLLNIRDKVAARKWLAQAPVNTAAQLERAPEQALQVAFTAKGLRAIGVPVEVLAGFSNEFFSGLSGDESRSRRLGDVGTNSPDNWKWGGPGNVPDMVLLLYSAAGNLDAWRQQIRGPVWDAAFAEIECLPTSDLFGVEPFGFKDGISQPELDWENRRQHRDVESDYTNRIALGEFLLGYPNEYGKYTDRPLLPQEPSIASLPTAEDQPDKRDFGRNGSYLVIRQLQQNVAAFWQSVNRCAANDPAARARISAAMVGRQLDGQPLTPVSSDPIDGISKDVASLNNFTFDRDAAGVQCPLGAHVRRANPRTADAPGGKRSLLGSLLRMLGFPHQDMRADIIASSRFHRILRRGREYGPGLSPQHALTAADSGQEERGIYFICLNANIARQFEFIQNAWMMNNKFDGLGDENDPLLGHQSPTSAAQNSDSFSIPQSEGVREHFSGLPAFVTVRGGAYFVLPGISALRYIAQLNG
jgi:Dyp-type peroxidase family